MSEYRLRLQEDEYAIPYHYQDLFAPGQAIERNTLFYSIIANFIDIKLPKQEIIRLIDIGCGDGRFCYFAKKYFEIEGLDISETALLWAKAFNPEIIFHNCHIEKLKSKYDGAVCLEVLEHIPDKEIDSFLSAIANVVSSKGTIIFTVPSTNKELIEKHFRHYHKEFLLETLNSFFDKIDIIGYGRIAPFHRRVFSLLNVISFLFYSQEFCWQFPNFVSTVCRIKKQYWAKHLHSGPPENCYRLAAICTIHE